MNEQEFLKKYDSEKPIFKAWGAFVNQTIYSALISRFGDDEKVKLFLRIQPEPRIKSDKSIISKAFFRGKGYSDPYENITDKVGLRYVVLLLDEIKIVSEIVEQTGIWTCSKDKDFENEINQTPFTFGYQSLHYIVRNKEAIKTNSINIPPNTPCEIQIRTLLQHACSELTHDTIYKPKIRNINPVIYRSIAKSIALSEATDDIFRNVSMTIHEENQKLDQLFEDLKSLYQSIRPVDYEEKTNFFILDALNELLSAVDKTDVERFLSEYPTVKDIILRKSSSFFLYKQPVILLLYYLIQYQRGNFQRLWPLTPADIQPLYSDLGIAFNNGI
jgi:putative GTP pyrophosphokinase